MHLHPRQAAWNEASQTRLSATVWFLTGFRSIRMISWTRAIHAKLKCLREEEMVASTRLRWVMVAYGASGMLPILSSLAFLLTNTSECIGNIFTDARFGLVYGCSSESGHAATSSTQLQDRVHGGSHSFHGHSSCEHDLHHSAKSYFRTDKCRTH
jgi:hypothetical protein